MIKLKSEKDIKILAQGGKILSGILKELARRVKPGVFTDDLEKLARRLIAGAGGKPAFLGYESGTGKYPAALCVSLNEAVVHTPATLRHEIKTGDVVSLDLGLWHQMLCTDAATTVIAGSAGGEEIKKLVSIAKKCLAEGIKQCRAGRPVSAIGKRIQEIAEGAGFGVIRDLVGHGVGFAVHEDPMVPNYYDRAFDRIILKEGMVIAIEPMITLGDGNIRLAEDGFTYRTADGLPAAHFEATVAVTKRGPVILTPLI